MKNSSDDIIRELSIQAYKYQRKKRIISYLKNTCSAIFIGTVVYVLGNIIVKTLLP